MRHCNECWCRPGSRCPGPHEFSGVAVEYGFQPTDNSLSQESGSIRVPLFWGISVASLGLVMLQAGTIYKCEVVNALGGNPQAVGDGSCWFMCQPSKGRVGSFWGIPHSFQNVPNMMKCELSHNDTQLLIKTAFLVSLYNSLVLPITQINELFPSPALRVYFWRNPN